MPCLASSLHSEAGCNIPHTFVRLGRRRGWQYPWRREKEAAEEATIGYCGNWAQCGNAAFDFHLWDKVPGAADSLNEFIGIKSMDRGLASQSRRLRQITSVEPPCDGDQEAAKQQTT